MGRGKAFVFQSFNFHILIQFPPQRDSRFADVTDLFCLAVTLVSAYV